MKKIQTALNEKENKHLMKIAEKNGTTPYAITKKLLKDFLKENGAVGMVLWLLCYELIVSTVVLVLL